MFNFASELHQRQGKFKGQCNFLAGKLIESQFLDKKNAQRQKFDFLHEKRLGFL